MQQVSRRSRARARGGVKTLGFPLILQRNKPFKIARRRRGTELI
jgi:hypothetical protein